MKFLINIFNVASHIGTGAWVASGINNSKYRNGATVLAAGLLAYQALGAWRKKDLAYPEVREILLGMGAILAYQRGKDWIENHPDEWEAIKSQAQNIIDPKS